MISSIQDFVALVESGDSESYYRLRNSYAAEEIWLQIIAERCDLLRSVTLNRHLPESVLRLLAANTDAAIRFDIAIRRSLPVDLFEQLANDADESVRARIACNKKTPRQILVKLTSDRSPIVSEPAKEQIANS